MKHFLVTAMVLVLLAFASCKQIERDWEETLRTNTVAGYDKFIERHPNSSFADEARQRINNLIVENAYKHASQFSGSEGATRIAIESRESGFTVYAGTVKVHVDPINDGEFRIKSEPENAAFKFELSALKMDEKTGELWSYVNLKLENGSILPAKWRKSLLGAEGVAAVFPDARNSTAISIRVNPGIGYTEYAGLRFKKAVTAAIRSDGTVEVDSEGIEATDKAGQMWVSRGVMIADRKTFVMWKKE